MVLPGDEIAVAEEFEPGDGTYERNGLVFAATPGVLFLDPENRVARVRAFNPPAELKIGDIVYGVVDDIRGMMATATILAIHGRTRQISGESEGTIHISNVSEEYTEDIHDMYRLGDIIRKLAADYADLRLFVPATELGGGKVEEKHREPRGEGHDRGGRDRDRGGGRDRYRERGGGRGRDGRGPGGRGGRDRDRGRRR